MNLNGTNKNKKRGILSLTRLVRDALPEQLRAIADDELTDQLPVLRPGVTSPSQASAMTPGGTTDGIPAPAGPPGPTAMSPAADSDEGLRRLAAQSRVSLGDFSPTERAGAVRRLEEEIHQRLARWVRLEDELRIRNTEMDRLQSELTTGRTTIVTLEVQVRSLTTERDDTRREVAQLRAELADERRNSGSSVEQQRALQQQADQLAAAADEKDRLLREAEARVEALMAELSGHRDAIIGLEGTLTDQKATYKRQEQEKAALADTIRVLEKKSEDLRGQLRNDSGAVAQLKADVEARAREAEVAAKQLESAQAEQQRLEIAFQKECSTAERLRTDAQGWEKAAQQAEATRRGIQERLAEFETTAGERNARLGQLEVALASLVAEKVQLASSLENQTAQLAERLKEVGELERVRGRLEFKCNAQLRTIDALHNEMRSHKKLVNVLSQGVSNVNEAAATVAALDAWVSHQVSAEEHPEGTTSPPPQPGVRVIETMDESGAVRYPLNKDVFTIGRSRDSDMRIGGKHTSRNHARILSAADEVVIEDLGSANGILVNASFVARSVLHHGDVVEIGGSRFRFVDEPARTGQMAG